MTGTKRVATLAVMYLPSLEATLVQSHNALGFSDIFKSLHNVKVYIQNEYWILMHAKGIVHIVTAN